MCSRKTSQGLKFGNLAWSLKFANFSPFIHTALLSMALCKLPEDLTWGQVSSGQDYIIIQGGHQYGRQDAQQLEQKWSSSMPLRMGPLYRLSPVCNWCSPTTGHTNRSIKHDICECCHPSNFVTNSNGSVVHFDHQDGDHIIASCSSF